MKQAYINKTFNTSTKKIIIEADAIIQEYQKQGLNLTLRQLYYQFVSRDLLPNKQSEYKRLGRIISDARLAGYIDWDAIEDRTRTEHSNTHWRDPGHIIKAAVNSFQVDHWAGQQYRPEVWIEKEALIGVIEPVCGDLDVTYFACKGYVSQSSMWKAYQRVNEYHDNYGQTPVIIHLGDHDPSGIDITRDIKDRQDLFGGGVIVERIALNMNQVNQYQPPPNPAKLTDSRVGSYLIQYGDKSWELDALEPSVLRDLIQKAVCAYRDENILAGVLAQEQEHKDILDQFVKNWKTL